MSVMPLNDLLAQTDVVLLPILEQLRSREPIFHTHNSSKNLTDFERMTAPDFWEIGASGRRYTREFILRMFADNELVDAHLAGWKTSDFALRRLGPDCFLLTYSLDQAGRLTRRATIWEKAGDDWRILYHQGTIVSAPEDKTMPSTKVPGVPQT